MCVFVFWDLCAYHFFLLKDVFESLKCNLDPWLSCMLTAFMSMFFSS